MKLCTIIYCTMICNFMFDGVHMFSCTLTALQQNVEILCHVYKVNLHTYCRSIILMCLVATVRQYFFQTVLDTRKWSNLRKEVGIRFPR